GGRILRRFESSSVKICHRCSSTRIAFFAYLFPVGRASCSSSTFLGGRIEALMIICIRVG
ncbi:unnamed protein product, partial [Amoebophrya sp. A120]